MQLVICSSSLPMISKDCEMSSRENGRDPTQMDHPVERYAGRQVGR